MPSFIFRDGEMVEVDDVVLDKSCEVTDPVRGTLVVGTGAQVVFRADVSGTVRVEAGAAAEVRGRVAGTFVVLGGGHVTFHSRLSGSLHVWPNATVTLASSAVALGSLHVDGTLTNHGCRGVSVSGSGQVIDTESATVQSPTEILDDGTVIYRD